MKQQIINALTDKIQSYNFKVDSINLSDDFISSYHYNLGDCLYNLKFRFIEYSNPKTMLIEPWIILFENKILEESKKIGVKALGFGGTLPTLSTRLGLYINHENRNGFFNSNKCIDLEFNKPLDVFIDKLLQMFIIDGVLDFIQKTNSLSKINELINRKSIDVNGKIKNLVHFQNNRPHQVLIGLILSMILNVNKGNIELLEIYKNYANKFKQENISLIDDILLAIQFYNL